MSTFKKQTVLLLMGFFMGSGASFASAHIQTDTTKKDTATGEKIKLITKLISVPDAVSTIVTDTPPASGSKSVKSSNAKANSVQQNLAALATVVAGRTPTNLDVSPSGAATYTMPIAAPPGINGVVPQVALTYNSQSGNGLAGFGWNISGVSTISRLPQTRYHDNKLGVVSLNMNDHYALDGQRLILKSGTYGADNAEYQTENYSNLRIVSKGGSASGPDYFIVYYPDGSTAFYGNSTSSKSVTEYGITYSENAQGIRVSYAYANDNNNLTITDISYGAKGTGSPINNIHFTYKIRQRGEHAYVGGTALFRSYLLSEINVTANANGYRNYVLTHSAVTDLGYERISSIQEQNYTRATGLAPITFDYDATDNLYDHQYISGLHASGIASTSSGVVTADLSGNGQMDFLLYPTAKDTAWVFLDPKTASPSARAGIAVSTGHFDDAYAVSELSFNNKIHAGQDILLQKHSSASLKNFEVYSTTSTQAFQIEYTRQWAAPTGSSYYSDETQSQHPGADIFRQYITGDFNGDGLTDVIAVNYPYADTTYIKKLGETHGTLESTVITTSSVHFINLDRRITSNFANLAGTFTQTYNLADRLTTGDFNGDGKTDLLHISAGKMYLYDLNDSNNLELLSTTVDSRITANYQFLVGDFNGDGKTDIVFPTADSGSGQNLFAFFISQGPAFKKYERNLSFSYESSSYDPSTTKLKIPFFVANDMDGDGKTDIIKAITTTTNAGTTGNVTVTVYSCMGMANADSAPTFVERPSYVDNNAPLVHYPIPLFMTKNEPNFGLEFGFMSGTTLSLFNFHKDLRQETPIKAVTQDGIKFLIDYGGLDGSMAAQNQVFPNMDIEQAPGFKLVSKLTRQNLEDNNTVFQSFSYYGGVMNTQGLGFLGFSRLSKTNWIASPGDPNQLTTTSINSPTLRGAPLQVFTSKYQLSALTNGLGVPGIIPDTTLSAPVTSAQTVTASNSIILSAGFIANGSNGIFNANISDPVNGISDGATLTDYITRTDYIYNTQLSANKVFTNVPKSVTVKNLLEGTNTLTTYAYDAYYNVTTEFDNFSAAGTKTTTTVYDNNPANGYIGRPLDKKTTSTTGGDSFSTEEQYIYTGFLPTQIKRKGNGTPFITDDITYDTYGNITSKTTTTAAGARTTGTQYEATGRFVNKITDIEGLQTTMQYDLNTGNMLSKTDPYSRTTTYSYDDWNRVLQTTNYLSVNSTRTYAKSNYDMVVTDVDDEGRQSVSTINAVGQTITEASKNVLGQLVSKSYQFDIYDRPVATSEPYTGAANQWNQTEYDEYGRIKKATAYTGKITTISYSGLSTTVNDGTKSVTTTKNALGNVISTTDPGGTINNTYFASGSLKSADFAGSTQTIEQDGWGHKTKLVDPSAGVYTYAYNEFGDITTETTPKGSTSYVYDANGKIQSKHITGDNTDMSYTYTYDGTSKLLTGTALTNTDGNSANYTYGYDTYNRPNSTIEDNTYAKFTKTITYDTYGRVSTETSVAINKSNSRTATKAITNNYQNGTLKSISDSNGQIWAVNGLDARGNVTSALLGTALKETNIFDTYGLPQEFKTELVSGSSPVQLMKLNYSFDAQRGNLTSRGHTNPAFTINESFTYDVLDRLTAYPDINSTSQTQTYDNGGRITNNSRIGDYTYTGNSYQQKGLVSLTDFAKFHYQNLPLQNVTYNAFKQPVEIKEQGKETISFQYNGDLQRAHMYYGSDNADKMQRPFRRHYSEDGGVEITEDIPNGKTSFVFYLGGDAYSAPAIWKQEQTASTTTAALYNLHRDYQGSILMITDINGAVKERRQFDAWGNITKLTDGAGNTLTAFSIIDRGYTGHEHLLGVGLINMNGRLYDPLLHRFLSPDNYIQDPSNTQNFNRYGYVMNNPLKYTDENGQFWQYVAAAVIGGVINVASNWSNIHSVGNFFAYFGNGALSGVVTAAGYPMLAASILTGGNNLISQVNTNGWDHINYWQLAGSAGFGALTSWGGDKLLGFVSPYISNFTSNIASPIISNALLKSSTNAVAGFALGAVSSTADGGSLGDILRGGLSGAAQGAIIGLISGSIQGYSYAKENDLDLWRGRSNLPPLEQPH